MTEQTKLSGHQEQELRAAIDQLDAVVTLAKANFPRTTQISIETSGCTPKASVQVASYVLAALIDAGRAALSQVQS